MEYSEVKAILTGSCEHACGTCCPEGKMCQQCSDDIIAYIDRLHSIIDKFIKTQEKYFQVPA